MAKCSLCRWDARPGKKTCQEHGKKVNAKSYRHYARNKAARDALNTARQRRNASAFATLTLIAPSVQRLAGELSFERAKTGPAS